MANKQAAALAEYKTRIEKLENRGGMATRKAWFRAHAFAGGTSDKHLRWVDDGCRKAQMSITD